jgi:putative membrane protein
LAILSWQKRAAPVKTKTAPGWVAVWKNTMTDFATIDLVLAIAHHVLIFLLAGVLAFEIGAIRSGMTSRDVLRVAQVDIWYGVFAAAILAVGFLRANLAAKGWAYYSTNVFFWAKIATFALVALLSLPPTITIIRWRRALAHDPATTPADADIIAVRRLLWAQAMLFAFIVSFAAAMARGYGALTR